MRRSLLLVLSLHVACSANVDPEPHESYIKQMRIDNGKETFLECSTGRWTGRITIAREVRVGYTSVRTTARGDSQSKTTLTLNDVPMVVEEGGLRFGADTRVPLVGASAVEIRVDGIFVSGAKAAELPPK